MFWKQKSRVFWLREGDLNTKFFQAITKQIRARNKITGLLDFAGIFVEDEEKIVAIALLKDLLDLQILSSMMKPWKMLQR